MTAVVRHPLQAELAERLGAQPRRASIATATARSGRRSRSAGARAHRPIVGGEVCTGGFELRLRLRRQRAPAWTPACGSAAPRGRLVLLGTAGRAGASGPDAGLGARAAHHRQLRLRARGHRCRGSRTPSTTSWNGSPSSRMRRPSRSWSRTGFALDALAGRDAGRHRPRQARIGQGGLRSLHTAYAGR